MKRIYYVVEYPDGEAVSRECSTLKEARSELKRISKEDDYYEYVISKYRETDVMIAWEGEVK